MKKLIKLLKEFKVNDVVLKSDEVIKINTNLGEIQINEYRNEMGRGVEIYINGIGHDVSLNPLDRETRNRGSIRLIQPREEFPK